MACAAVQCCANASGSTCRWSCTLVHAASGAIVSAWVERRSTPVIEIPKSSPRAANPCSFSLAELGLEVRVRDRVKRRGVYQRRLAAVIGQVQLDLEPEGAALRMKP